MNNDKQANETVRILLFQMLLHHGKKKHLKGNNVSKHHYHEIVYMYIV